MTTNHDTQTAAPPRRRITKTAKLIIAAGAIALGAMSLSPATANAEKRGPNGDAFHDCAMDAFRKFRDGTIDWNSYKSQEEDCCLNLGGTYNEETDECYIDGEPTADRPKPPPGATVILPPDVGQTQLGPTQPPAATANLHPGLNTRAGIQ